MVGRVYQGGPQGGKTRLKRAEREVPERQNRLKTGRKERFWEYKTKLKRAEREGPGSTKPS